MKIFSVVLMLVVCGMVQNVQAENLQNIIRRVWVSYTPKKGCEHEESVISSSNWSSEKHGTRWICYDPKKMLFVLNHDQKLKQKPAGVLFGQNSSFFGFHVHSQRKGSKVKSRAGSFNSFANGTNFTYFDLARSIGESLNDYSYSGWRKSPSSHLDGQEWNVAMKVANKHNIRGDYAYRVFRIVFLKHGSKNIPAVAAVEYFCKNGELCKIQSNIGLHVTENGLWRTKEVIVKKIEKGRVIDWTTVKVGARKFLLYDIRLDKQALKNGKPKSW